ncbi:MAG: YggS family pyridoxal phosphate-dependent enzyme, partial [Proteobacteria bacterium]|nr:YggS family pyridoxal phosphate-dependent enzyme [Pseudomonadota bacterium]
MQNIGDAIKTVQEKIEKACARSGRSASEVRLIGVTKRVDIGRIKEAMACGLKDFGENYIQEAKKKIEEITPCEEISWHMIGHIQTNKVKFLPGMFGYIHSVDRWELAELLDRYGKEMNVLFELNLSGEATKQGTTVDNLKRMLERVNQLKNIKPVGLMTMAPFVDDPEEVRGVFKGLGETLHEANREFLLNMTELSMGMSSDFEV